MSGARLPAERELAVLLGVSRTSVREAIISLEMSGLVEVRVGTGIFVTPAGGHDRASRDAGPGPFELLARASSSKARSRRWRQRSRRPRMPTRCAELERIEANVDDFAAREVRRPRFPLRLAKATGNSSLELVVEGLWDQRAELWGRMQQHFHTPELAEQTIRDHAAIVAAIAAHDPDAARAAMHRHMARVVREFQRGVDRRSPASGARGPHRRVGRTKAQGGARMMPASCSKRAARTSASRRSRSIGSTGIVPNTGGFMKQRSVQSKDGASVARKLTAVALARRRCSRSAPAAQARRRRRAR